MQISILLMLYCSLLFALFSFVRLTCFLAILDKKDGKVIFANAGHNKPIVGYECDYHYLDCFTGCL